MSDYTWFVWFRVWRKAENLFSEGSIIESMEYIEDIEVAAEKKKEWPNSVHMHTQDTLKIRLKEGQAE